MSEGCICQIFVVWQMTSLWLLRGQVPFHRSTPCKNASVNPPLLQGGYSYLRGHTCSHTPTDSHRFIDGRLTNGAVELITV